MHEVGMTHQLAAARAAMKETNATMDRVQAVATATAVGNHNHLHGFSGLPATKTLWIGSTGNLNVTSAFPQRPYRCPSHPFERSMTDCTLLTYQTGSASFLHVSSRSQLWSPILATGVKVSNSGVAALRVSMVSPSAAHQDVAACNRTLSLVATPDLRVVLSDRTRWRE